MAKIDDVMHSVEEANALVAQGKYIAARTAIRTSPYYGDFTDATAPLYFAELNSLLAEGKIDEAYSTVNKIRLRDDTALVVKLYWLSYVAQIQQELGKLSDALAAVEEAKTLAAEKAEIDSDIICDINARQGYILCAMERWDDALALLMKAKERCAGTDQEISIYLHIAYCLHALHLYADALLALEPILRSTSQTTPASLVAQAYFRRGAILLEMKRYSEAYLAFAQAEGHGSEQLEGAIRDGKNKAAALMSVN